MATTVATKGASREGQDNSDAARGTDHELQRREGSRRGSLWSRFRNLSQRGMRLSKRLEESNVKAMLMQDCKKSAKGPLIGNIVVKCVEEEKKKEPTTIPRLKDEEPQDEDVDDGDKKQAAKVNPKETIVAVVTMDEAIYSNDRMVEAQKKLGPFLQPEPYANETGEIDIALERGFLVKDEESAKEIVKMMQESNDLSPEFKLLTVAAFRNTCLENKDLTKHLLCGSSDDMIGARIMDLWMYQAIKNLEHLATNVDSDEKRWFHALTDPFTVMECLKFIWDCLATEKKEQLSDKRKQLHELHEEFGLDWNQPTYLDDVKACGRTIGADALVRMCETIKSRLIAIMSAKDYTKIDNIARHRCAGGFARSAPIHAPPQRPVPFRHDDSSPEQIERAERERAARIERARAARFERIRRLEAIRAAAVAARGGDDAEEGANAEQDREVNERRDRVMEADRLMEADARFREAMALHERAMEAIEARRTAQLRQNNAGANNNDNEEPEEVNDQADRDGALAARGAQVRRNEEAVVNNESFEQLNNRTEAEGEAQPERALNDAERFEEDSSQAESSHGVARADVQPFGAVAVERSEQSNYRAADHPLVGELQNSIHRALLPRRINRATNNSERVEPAENRLPANARDIEDFSAAVARAALPHIDDERRAVFARTLRDDDERAAAMVRRLDLEETEMLWGPRLPARRRFMMARRAMRYGELDVLEAEHELLDLDMLAYMDDMEHYEPFGGFDRLAHPMRPQPPRRPPARQPVPSVPRHLKELRELEEAAKMKPFSVSEGLELAKPSPDFDTQNCFIRRVTACVGWAIHGLIFEFVDGTRMGTLMVNPGDRPMKLNDKNLADRACVGWTDIEYGDYVVKMHGDTLGDGVQSWFCYSLVLTFASGRTVHYEANHEPWRGGPFSFAVPQTTPCFVHRISFKHDQQEDMLGLVTSIHLPISQKTLTHLPVKQQKAVEDVLEIGKDLDVKLEKNGLKPMGEDVWFLILGFIRAWELLPPSSNAKGTKDGQRLWDLLTRRFEYSLPG